MIGTAAPDGGRDCNNEVVDVLKRHKIGRVRVDDDLAERIFQTRGFRGINRQSLDQVHHRANLGRMNSVLRLFHANDPAEVLVDSDDAQRQKSKRSVGQCPRREHRPGSDAGLESEQLALTVEIDGHLTDVGQCGRVRAHPRIHGFRVTICQPEERRGQVRTVGPDSV